MLNVRVELYTYKYLFNDKTWRQKRRFMHMCFSLFLSLDYIKVAALA